MPSCTMTETFHRVATQPGSTVKRWDREELVRCRATGTGIAVEANLKGPIHPVFADWVDTESELREELEQPILLASKILETVGLPWLSDFLVDDIFDENYPGRERGSSFPAIPAFETKTTPYSIVRHHGTYGATREQKRKWRESARDILRNDLPKLVQWQIDKDIFQQRGWNGYTCRHPRGDLPLSEIDKHETIERSDSVSPHEGSRSLTILLAAEFPARLVELRRQGKAQSEEYLLTALMAAVTMLHELGHAIYWKDRRSLTWDLREPFYGADLEMELGDSFVAAIFGGWIPRPVRELAALKKDFGFADGVAWRQALNWDHHRMRPKYRAHYSIPVDYIAGLFTEANWSITFNKAVELVRPKSLTGNSIALRTVGLYTPLEQSSRHATAAIADFHCHDDGWVWNRRPGAWFRIPQYDGCMYPELELPRAGEDAMCPPMARESCRRASMRYEMSPSPLIAKKRDRKEKAVPRTSVGFSTDEWAETTSHTEVRVRGGDAFLPVSPPPLRVITITSARAKKINLSPRKSEFNPRKFARGSPATKIPRPVVSSSPVMGCDADVSAATVSRKRDRAMTSLTGWGKASGVSLQRPRSPSPGPGQWWPQQQQPIMRADPGYDEEDQNISWTHQHHQDGDGDVGNYDHDEISVEELKKRLSQLIGLSLTELEKMLDTGPERGRRGATTV
ncbi:hypothetical protein F5Y03DRAFT_242469 [Xylaria venustula]|nr:hypothetical protein F5Y03DRAFT_242469 [Xylaria venustula]